MPVQSSDSGFTLIELSIVLVIIGLLVGGILAGRDLIHAAEIRAVISEEQKLVTAVNTFKLTYNCIPGDCANATDYFGQAANCSGAVSLTTGTCNGSGDGVICSPSDTSCNGTGGTENLLAVHHLYIAHLINLPLATPNNTTVKAFGITAIIPGQNMLGSNALQNLGWELLSIPSSQIATSGNFWFCGAYPSNQNELFFGGKALGYLGGNNGAIPGANFISGFDAYTIDTKIDDGKPETGYVISPPNTFTSVLLNYTPNTCSASFQSAEGYNLSARGSGSLVFMTNF